MIRLWPNEELVFDFGEWAVTYQKEDGEYWIAHWPCADETEENKHGGGSKGGVCRICAATPPKKVKTAFNLGKQIDLNQVSREIQNTEYNSERFPGLFIRFNHPKCVIILFKNGKLIMTGLKSFDHIKIINEALKSQ